MPSTSLNLHKTTLALPVEFHSLPINISHLKYFLCNLTVEAMFPLHIKYPLYFIVKVYPLHVGDLALVALKQR